MSASGPICNVSPAVKTRWSKAPIRSNKAFTAAAMLRDGRLIELFPEWNGEVFPPHDYHPPRHLPPAKVRAFLRLVNEITR